MIEWESNWEDDPRSLGDCLIGWQDAHGWSGAEAARQMRLPYLTYRNWLPGGRRKCRLEQTIRRMMTLIDRLGAG